MLSPRLLLPFANVGELDEVIDPCVNVALGGVEIEYILLFHGPSKSSLLLFMTFAVL